MTSFIISGIRSDIGIQYAKVLQQHGKVYGISRSNERIDGIEYTHIV